MIFSTITSALDLSAIGSWPAYLWRCVMLLTRAYHYLEVVTLGCFREPVVLMIIMYYDPIVLHLLDMHGSRAATVQGRRLLCISSYTT